MRKKRRGREEEREQRERERQTDTQRKRKRNCRLILYKIIIYTEHKLKSSRALLTQHSTQNIFLSLSLSLHLESNVKSNE